MKYRLALATILLSTTVHAQSSPWDSLEHEGARYAGTKDERQNAVVFVCPVTGAPQMIVQSPQFRVSVPDDGRYTVTIATDRGRSEVVATAKDAEIVYTAGDINTQIMLQRLAEEIAASQQLTVAISSLGWKAQFTGEGAAMALKPMIGGC